MVCLRSDNRAHVQVEERSGPDEPYSKCFEYDSHCHQRDNCSQDLRFFRKCSENHRSDFFLLFVPCWQVASVKDTKQSGFKEANPVMLLGDSETVKGVKSTAVQTATGPQQSTFSWNKPSGTPANYIFKVRVLQTRLSSRPKNQEFTETSALQRMTFPAKIECSQRGPGNFKNVRQRDTSGHQRGKGIQTGSDNAKR